MNVVRFLLVLIAAIFISHTALAQEEVAIDSTRKFTVDVVNDSLQRIYYAPKWYEAITHIPANFADAGRIVTSKKVIKPLVIVAGTTAALYAADRWIIDGVHQLSDNIGLKGAHNIIPLVTHNGTYYAYVPRSANQGLIFLGDGLTHTLIFSGIAVHGLITNNQKEVRLLTQAISGYIATQITIRVLKFSFGREMPINATSTRGTFHPFLSVRHSENYGSMPSGHLASMMFTVTLLAETYPNSKFIQPVGYSLMALCAFGLMNKGVHWASDFPLGIAIGYMYGTVAANRGRLTVHGRSSKLLDRIDVLPTVMFDGTMGVSLRVDMSPFNARLR